MRGHIINLNHHVASEELNFKHHLDHRTRNFVHGPPRPKTLLPSKCLNQILVILVWLIQIFGITPNIQQKVVDFKIRLLQFHLIVIWAIVQLQLKRLALFKGTLSRT